MHDARAVGADGDIVAVKDIHHRYSGVRALNGVSIAIPRGSFTAILGPNGAGKSTLAHILAGLLKPTSGEIAYRDGDGAHRDGEGRVRDGICLVPEGRRLFGQLTIEENLVAAGYGADLGKKEIQERLRKVAELLPPALQAGMDSRLAMSLSGGERQLLALSRALMSDPRLIILDEPSMGLAPIMVDRVYEILSELNERGVAVIVIEQIATHAVDYADMLHVLARGKVIYSGLASDDAAEHAIHSSYVGRVEESIP